MNSPAAQRDLAEPHLGEVLAGAGLDTEYVRAEGDTIYHLDAHGQEIAVLDMVGGYGSLMFGHNNPQLVAYAKTLLEAKTPVHAQFSRSRVANEVTAKLNRIVRRELETDEPYYAIFANSGAEAIEAAVKHAELDRVMRIGALMAEIDQHVEQARAAVRNGAAVRAGERLRPGTAEPAGGESGLEQLIGEMLRHNAAVADREPIFLALEGGFHGKLMGSVQLTHNPGYREPFKALAAQARFVPTDQPELLKKIVYDERLFVLDLAVDGNTVTVVERGFPIVCAFLLEPIQGEGGINVLSRELIAEIRRVCTAIDCPVIVDEIQSGMGRTGTFLASSQLGLRGDYYALAKSLGGGLAKASVMLVREGRYRKEFELVHSSTFAKDGFSSRIAAKVLDMLEAENGLAYRVAAQRGAALKAKLEAVRADYPEVVKDVRGMGLMLGIEFHDLSGAPSPVVQGVAASGFFGYVVAGFLLRAHRIRIFPTASAVNTLRFEPSIFLSDEQIAHVDAALRDVCKLLRDEDGQRLVTP